MPNLKAVAIFIVIYHMVKIYNFIFFFGNI